MDLHPILILPYVFIAIVVGKVSHDRFDLGPMSLWVGMWWPIAIFIASGVLCANWITRSFK